MVKARLLGSFAQRIAILEEIADAAVVMREKCSSCGYVATTQVVSDKEQPGYSERLKSIDLMGKYAGDEDDVPADEVRKRLTNTLDVIRDKLPADIAAALIADLRAVWA